MISSYAQTTRSYFKRLVEFYGYKNSYRKLSLNVTVIWTTYYILTLHIQQMKHYALFTVMYV